MEISLLRYLHFYFVLNNSNQRPLVVMPFGCRISITATQRRGCCDERTSSAMSELCRLRRSEGYGACEDAARTADISRKAGALAQQASSRWFESSHSDHVAADVISFAATFLFKSHFSLILSQLLSKSNPLRWASIWFYETLSFRSFNGTRTKRLSKDSLFFYVCM